MVRTKVRGHIFEIIKDLPANTTWADIKLRLNSEITPPISKFAARNQLVNAKQKQNETVHEFAKRIKNFLRELNVTSCDKVTSNDMKKFIQQENEHLAKQTFEDGLFSSELRIQARTQNKDSLTAAITEAVDNEARIAPSKPTCSHCKKSNHTSENCFSNNNKKKNNVKKSLFCSFCKIPGHSYEECRSKNIKNKNMDNNGKNKENKPEVICVYCKEKGHYANQCPRRPSSSKNIQSKQINSIQNEEAIQVLNHFEEIAQIHVSENFPGQNA